MVSIFASSIGLNYWFHFLPWRACKLQVIRANGILNSGKWVYSGYCTYATQSGSDEFECSTECDRSYPEY